MTKPIIERADPERLKKVMEEARIAFAADYLQQKWGLSRTEAVKHIVGPNPEDPR